MAFSGSNDFTYTRDQIIKAALRKCRAYDVDGGAPEAYQIRDAAEALNLIAKRMSTKGTVLWSETELEIQLAKGKASYTVGASAYINTTRPLRMHHPRLRTNSTKEDVPLQMYSRSDYTALTNKFSTGTPTAIWYDRSITQGVVYVWPVPDVSTKKLIATADIPLQDFDASGNDAHCPSYVYEYFVWALAAAVAPEYGIPLPERQEFTMRAMEYENDVLEYEFEEEGVQFVPSGSWR
jgi:hypothetical protein